MMRNPRSVSVGDEKRKSGGERNARRKKLDWMKKTWI